METIYEKIQSAQNGNEPAMLELIEQFSPLLKKYARLLGTEDAFDELMVDFIELVMTLNLDGLRSHDDGVLVSYISQTIKSKYIFKSKQNSLLSQNVYWDDLEKPTQWKYEPRSSLFSEEADFSHTASASILTEKEYDVISMVFLYGYSSAEIARMKNTTRQAVNQIKCRALKKLKKMIEETFGFI